MMQCQKQANGSIKHLFLNIYASIWGTTKLRNENETKRNEMKRNEIQRNETKYNETKNAETKRNETK